MGNQVQIGPQMDGAFITGTCDGNELGFGVYPAAGASAACAWYSLDAGSNWTALANGQITLVEPTGNPVQWRVSQALGPVKLVITPGNADPG